MDSKFEKKKNRLLMQLDQEQLTIVDHYRLMPTIEKILQVMPVRKAIEYVMVVQENYPIKKVKPPKLPH